MGATGAVIMSFFAAVFASMALAIRSGWHTSLPFLPFLIFAGIAIAARVLSRRAGQRPDAPKRTGRVILWSSVAEGVGIFVAANVVANLGHPELLLPAIALVVGLHFLPMAYLIPFRPFYLLGGTLVAVAVLAVGRPDLVGARSAGFAAALVLWTAALLALRRQAAGAS